MMLGQITVTALKPGSTQLTAEVKVLNDDSGKPIQASLTSFTLVVALPSMAHAPSSGSAWSSQRIPLLTDGMASPRWAQLGRLHEYTCREPT